jgi:hypothetical protein
MADFPAFPDRLEPVSIPATQLDRHNALPRGSSPHTPLYVDGPATPQRASVAAKDDELAQLERDHRIKEIQHKLRMQELAEAKAQAELDAIRCQGSTTQTHQGTRDDDDTEIGEKYPQEVI